MTQVNNQAQISTGGRPVPEVGKLTEPKISVL